MQEFFETLEVVVKIGIISFIVLYPCWLFIQRIRHGEGVWKRIRDFIKLIMQIVWGI